MNISTRIEHIRDIVRYWKKQDQTIALVPTMGKVTEEHVELIQRALKISDRVVVSMFVNPLQFSSKEEMLRHETDFEGGEEICRQLGVHQLFIPEVEEMYGGRFCTYVVCEEWPDGNDDPENYQYYKGCCTVVMKLFHIIEPDCLYIRSQKAKDAEVFRKLAHDMNMNVEIYTG